MHSALFGILAKWVIVLGRPIHFDFFYRQMGKITLGFFIQSRIKIKMPLKIRGSDRRDPLEMIFGCRIFRSCLKIRTFVRDQGEAADQSAGILKYVEDLIRGLNADTCPPPADRAKRLF